MMHDMRKVRDQIEIEAIKPVRKNWRKSFQRKHCEGRLRFCQRREEGCAIQRGQCIQSSTHGHDIGCFRERCRQVQ